MASVQSIDAKEGSLRKALEDLQSHSSLLSAFTLKWKDLEDDFESIKKSIEARFKALESVNENQSSSPVNEPANAKLSGDSVSMPTSMSYPEMTSLCVKMDGVGLRSYIVSRPKELHLIRNEIGVALLSAVDPGKLVLDAIRGFYRPNSEGDKDEEVGAIRRTCVLLLENLAGVSPQITPEVREQAKILAFEWKGKVCTGDKKPIEALSLLQLLATYGLGAEFSAEELVELALKVSRGRQTIDLCRALGLSERIPDVIEKLSLKGRQLDGIKFAYAFDLVDRFPPISLLKAYHKHSKKVAEEVRNKGNRSVQAMNEATAKELAAVRKILKCLQEHNLESQYPREILDKRIERLEKQKADRKRPASGPVPAPKKQKPYLGNEHPRPVALTTVSTAPVASISQIHLQPSSSLANRVSPYMNSSMQYGLTGTSSAVGRYIPSAAGSYGLGASSLSYGGNLSPSSSHLYSSGSRLMASVYNNRSLGLGAQQGFPTSHRPLFYP